MKHIGEFLKLLVEFPVIMLLVSCIAIIPMGCAVILVLMETIEGNLIPLMAFVIWILYSCVYIYYDQE